MSISSDFSISLLKTALPKNRFQRLVFLLIMTSVVFVGMTTLIFNEIKNLDIRKSQLEIEKSRVTQIDKQLNSFYQKTYSQNDSSLTHKVTTEYYLKQIEFLKNQRTEAVKNIDNINQNPDSQILIFTIIVIILTLIILLFFSSSFKTSENMKSTFDRIRYENRKNYSSGANDFLQWAITTEISQNNLGGLDLDKAKKLKKIYDLSEKLGDDKNDLLNAVMSFTNLKRKQEEIENEKHSDILLIFQDMQSRLKDECNRLNKQALINLFLCFFIAFILMGFIAYTSIFSTEFKDISTIQIFLIRYIPRVISILSLLTMFLYFTRLYKSNIIDVKYYHNEITNIELKMAAVQTVLINGDKEIINQIVKELCLVERNSVMSKEQTTVELERAKAENEINKNYLDKVWELLKVTSINTKAENNSLT